MRDGVIVSESGVEMSEVKVGEDESESKVKDGDRREAERVIAGSAVGEMDLRVDLRPWRWAFRWPREVARARGGLARTIWGVRRGSEERKPERMAKRKVEREGEPKLRWVYRTHAASEMLRMMGTEVVVRPSMGGVVWFVGKKGMDGKIGVG